MKIRKNEETIRMNIKIQQAFSIILYILLFVIFVFSVTLFWPAYKRYSDIKNDLAALNHELRLKINESVMLNREVHDLEHKPAAAEKVAREKYNLCKEGEIILKYDE